MATGFYDLYRVKQPACTPSGRTPPARWSDGKASFQEISQTESQVLKGLDKEPYEILEWMYIRDEIREHSNKYLAIKVPVEEGDKELDKKIGAFTNEPTMSLSTVAYWQCQHILSWLNRRRKEGRI